MSESNLHILYVVLSFAIIFLAGVITKCLLYALDFVGWGFDQNILTIGITAIIVYNILCTLIDCLINLRHGYEDEDE